MTSTEHSSPDTEAAIPTELHKAAYLRGWNEAAERAAEIAENNGWETTAAQIRGLIHS